MAKAQAEAASTDETKFQGVMDTEGEGFTYDMGSQEEDSGYPILPKGTYDAIIDGCDYQISKSSGNPMWKITHLITGPDPDIASKNLKMFSYVVFKSDGMGRVKTFLVRVGAGDLATASFNPKTIADDGTLVGKAHRVKLDIRKSEEYGDGNEVKGVLASAGAGAAGGGGFSM
jgi:hypothetical protein